MLLALILVAPLLGAAAAAGATSRRALVLASLVPAAVLVALSIALTVETNHAVVRGVANALRADSLSAFFAVVIALVALVATAFTARVVTSSTPSRHDRLYGVLIQVFLACMLAAVLAANLGVMWVSIEATTIATTFLVAHRRDASAFEAAWKYAVLCGVGIALAFLGLVLLNFAATHGTGTSPTSPLDWAHLARVAPGLDAGVARVAFALLVMGFGTKVGLVPMHTWLPDAHGEAPAPVSSLMSGVLLAVALYAILRVRSIVVLATGPGFPRALLLVVGLASLGVAALMMYSQRNYKRLLAYSSIEHMGLCAVGAAVATPLALAGVLLHVLGHALTKSGLFLVAGEIKEIEGTTSISAVRGLLARHRVVGGLFGAGLVSLVGLPPFSLFLSELTILRAGTEAGLTWAVLLAGAALVLGATGIARHARVMLLGPGDPATRTSPRWIAVPVVGALAVSVVVGLAASPLIHWLSGAAAVVVR